MRYGLVKGMGEDAVEMGELSGCWKSKEMPEKGVREEWGRGKHMEKRAKYDLAKEWVRMHGNG